MPPLEVLNPLVAARKQNGARRPVRKRQKSTWRWSLFFNFCLFFQKLIFLLRECFGCVKVAFLIWITATTAAASSSSSALTLWTPSAGVTLSSSASTATTIVVATRTVTGHLLVLVRGRWDRSLKIKNCNLRDCFKLRLPSFEHPKDRKNTCCVVPWWFCWLLSLALLLLLLWTAWSLAAFGSVCCFSRSSSLICFST